MMKSLVLVVFIALHSYNSDCLDKVNKEHEKHLKKLFSEPGEVNEEFKKLWHYVKKKIPSATMKRPGQKQKASGLNVVELPPEQWIDNYKLLISPIQH